MSKEGDTIRIVHFQTKQIIYNIYSYLKARKSDPTTYEHKNDINLVNTISAMTKLSKSSIGRTIRKGNDMKYDTGSVCFKDKQPKKHVRKKRINVGAITEGIIRRRVIQYYKANKEVPSIRKLNTILKEEKILQCSTEYLRQLLHKLGFTNSGKDSDGSFVESDGVVMPRLRYTQAIKEYRQQDRSVFFLNDTSSWDDETDLCRPLQTAALNTLKAHNTIIIVHMDGEGFKDSVKVMVKATCDYYEGIDNFETYEWVKDTLLPAMPARSVVVMNTSYEVTSAEDDKLTMSSTRSEMEAFLKKHSVDFNETGTKTYLYQKIVDYKNKAKYKYNIGKLLLEHDHEILRFPEYVSDLNPALNVWHEMKFHADKTSPWTVFEQYSPENWEKYLSIVKENETEYYEHDTRQSNTAAGNEPKEDIVLKKEIEPEELDCYLTNEESSGSEDNMDDSDENMVFCSI